MRLLRLEIENVRSHERLDLDLASVTCAAIVGRNGAGKSTILRSIDWALYGGGAPDRVLRHGAPKGSVSLTFELGGEVFRVARGRERGRRSWLVLERKLDPPPAGVDASAAWEPSGTHTIVETQAAVERLLGMDGPTFRATVYAPQGQAGLLASMTPGDRKGLIGSLLDLDRYETWRERAAGAARDLATRCNVLEGEVGGLREQLDAAHEALAGLSEEGLTAAMEAAERAVAAAEEEVTAAIAREQAAEQVRRRADLHRRMDELRAQAEAVVARARRLEALEAELTGARAHVEGLQALEDARRQHDVAVASWQERRDAADEQVREWTQQGARAQLATTAAEGALPIAEQRVLDRESTIRSLHADAERLQGLAEEQRRAAAALTAGTGARCEECGQEIVDEDALEHARGAARRRAEELDARAASAAADARRYEEALRADQYAVKEAQERVERARAQEAEYEDRLTSAQAARAELEAAPGAFEREEELQEKRAGLVTVQRLEGGISALREQIKADPSTADLRSEWAAAKAEAEQLPESVPEGLGVEYARRNVTVRIDERTAAERALSEFRSAMAAADELEAELERRRDVHRELAEQRVALEVVARAFSRNGIPALILDGAVDAIEVAANEVLERLETTMRLRLATQVEKKSGKGMAETLDILVDDGVAELPIEELSGGERYRVHIALRLGMGQVLGGAAFECLLIDETTDLDQQGLGLLAEMLTAMPDRQVMLVTHEDDLSGALPQTMLVSRRSAASPSEVALA
jgi:exonuclease SbcC